LGEPADELPALAFGSHYFVFKERPGTHLSSGVGAGLPEGLYRTDSLRWKVSFGCRRAKEGPSAGSLPYQMRAEPSTRGSGSICPRIVQDVGPGPTPRPSYPGADRLPGRDPTAWEWPRGRAAGPGLP
jgi:hypothetical protein